VNAIHLQCDTLLQAVGVRREERLARNNEHSPGEASV
jgi:hypothetical protein